MEMNSNSMNALAKLTYGLYVLTTKKGEEIDGMIVSWVSQVSFEPPRVIVGVRKNRYSHSLIQKSSVFALNVLSREDRGLVSQFKASSSEEKFKGLDWEKKSTGAPIINGTLAYMDCRVVNSIDAGDHTLFIGEILDAELLKAGVPLTSMDYGKVYLGQN